MLKIAPVSMVTLATQNLFISAVTNAGTGGGRWWHWDIQHRGQRSDPKADPQPFLPTLPKPSPKGETTPSVGLGAPVGTSSTRWLTLQPQPLRPPPLCFVPQFPHDPPIRMRVGVRSGQHRAPLRSISTQGLVAARTRFHNDFLLQTYLDKNKVQAATLRRSTNLQLLRRGITPECTPSPGQDFLPSFAAYGMGIRVYWVALPPGPSSASLPDAPRCTRDNVINSFPIRCIIL